MADLYPLHFDPILKRLIWGGTRLGRLLQKPIGPEGDYAECWEIADHGRDISRVSSGPLAGQSLRGLVQERGQEILGSAVAATSQFPLLLKFLDANDVLSVQVHPDDALARQLVQDNGKTEAWVIVYAEPGSLLYAGLKPGVTRESLELALDTGAIEGLLHRLVPRVGDCILINAGTIHAIGAGILLAEVQQMSDATFRIYDWGRVGADGLPRRLHRQEALMATDFTAGPVTPARPVARKVEGGTIESLVACSHFKLERLTAAATMQVGQSDRFTALLSLGGHAQVRHEGVDYRLNFGDALLLPAAIGPCELNPQNEASVLCCTVP